MIKYLVFTFILLIFSCSSICVANDKQEIKNSSDKGYLLNARRAFNSGNYNLALAEYKKGLEQNALGYEDFAVLATIYEKKGDLLKSAQMDEIAFFIKGTYEDVDKITIKYRDAGDPFSALAFLYKVEAWSKDMSEFHFEKGKYYNEIGYKIIGGFYFDLSADEDLDSPGAAVARSVWEMNEFSRNGKAVQDLEYLISTKDTSQYELYCIALVNLGKYDEAWSLIEKLGKRRGKGFKALECSLKSSIKAGQSDLKTALSYAREAIEFSNYDIDYYFRLSDLCFMTGDVNAAIEACEEGIAKNPRSKRIPNMLFLKAKYRYTVDRKNAGKDVDESFKRDKDRWLDFTDIAYGNYIKNKTKKSDQVIVGIEKIPVKTPAMCYRLASYFSLTGNVPKALFYVELALRGGYDNYTKLVNNPDFSNLKRNVDYTKMLQQLKTKNKEVVLKKYVIK